MVTSFKARDMPVTLLRGNGTTYTNPNWTRLQRHITKHEKAGGVVLVKTRWLEEAVSVGRFSCVELADVELFSPAPFI